jgi:hypothetical protein
MTVGVLIADAACAIGPAHGLIHRKLATLSGLFRSISKPWLALNLGKKVLLLSPQHLAAKTILNGAATAASI